MPAFETVARSTRGGFTECWHQGAAAVVTTAGRLVARIADPELPVLLRSAAKPVQIVPLLRAGGEERFGLENRDLALIAASHAGTEAHVRRVASLLERGGFDVADLQCGPHPPLDPKAARRLAVGGDVATALHNNCSGKHAGLLLACRCLELDSARYLERDHPLQRSLREEVACFSGVAAGAVEVAVDGCGLPTFRLPLAALARLYSRFANPPESGLDEERRKAAGRLVEAYVAAPGMVAGPGRFTTCLTEATGGRVLGKEGADGLYAVAVRGPIALGAAVKVVDGTEECRPGVVLDLLRQLGVLSALEFRRLESFHSPVRRNHAGLEVGRVEPDLALRQVS